MVESTSEREQMDNCGHGGCKCRVKPGQTYCSDYCVKASGASASNQLPARQSADFPCECSHSDCGDAQ
jgi:hypothetical protein